MMEEIDFVDQEMTPNPFEQKPKSNNNVSHSTGRTPGFAVSSQTSEPLRLPRTSGNSRGTFLRDTLQSQIPTTEQLQKRKKQAGKVLKSFGNQLGKLNLGKLIDNMEQDQGLADSLEKLNSRMKEEAERQEIRREAEELTLKVITDHLGEFLAENPLGTYEEWIQDLHPENANQGKLLSDIQQIDERFYVMESDHRKIWNDAIEKQEKEKNGDSDNTSNTTSYAHRIVKARTQIWGKAPGVQTNVQSQNQKSGYTDNPLEDSSKNSAIDFLSNTNPQNAPAAINATPNPIVDDKNGIEEIDFFASTVNPTTENFTLSGSTIVQKSKNDPFQDLMQF